MSIRTRLIIITTAVVFLLFGVAEWISYQHTSALLGEYEAILAEASNREIALKSLKETRERAFVNVTTVRIIHAAVTLVIAAALLNYLWYRVIYRPITRLLSQIHIMGLGTWKSALPVHRTDEIGELTIAFNKLGEQLTSTFRHINSASRLSALALIGNKLVRDIHVVRGQIAGVAELVESKDGLAGAALSLAQVQAKLQDVEAQFQQDFDREVQEASRFEAGPETARTPSIAP
jgi:methyl-accepting chemotaxis protein